MSGRHLLAFEKLDCADGGTGVATHKVVDTLYIVKGLHLSTALLWRWWHVFAFEFLCVGPF
jgi:hypothetical protein